MVPTRSLLLVGVVLSVSVGQIGGQPWPKTSGLSAQICVERPGDNGALNIRLANVVIGDSGPILSLMGEQAACAYVEPGQYAVHAQSPDPYDPESKDPAKWKSAPLSLVLTAGQRVILDVCGTGSNAAYRNWKVQRSGPRC